MAKRRKEKKGKAKSLIVLLIFIIIAGGAFLGYRILKDRENEETSSGDGIIFNSKKEEKQVQIFKGDERWWIHIHLWYAHIKRVGIWRLVLNPWKNRAYRVI